MQIVGIQSLDMAKIIKEKEEKENRKEYSKAERHNVLCFIVIFLLGATVATFVNFALNDFQNPFIEFDIFDVCIYLMCMIFGIMIYIFIRDEVEYKCYVSDFTPIYQYAIHTNGKNVLKTDYKYKESFFNQSGFVLMLDLEDIDTKKVTKEEIGVFNRVVRTDVKDVTFDLNTREFIVPYRKDGF